jgi:hypothetical protein
MGIISHLALLDLSSVSTWKHQPLDCWCATISKVNVSSNAKN